MLFAWICAAYAYFVNSRRLSTDPKKREFYLAAVFLAPVSLPVFVVAYISLFLLRVLAYGVFLVLFLFALIFLRKPFILEWLKKIALAIGNRLLEANTFLIRVFLQPLTGSRGSA